jgi:hypothetical protein
LIELRNEFEFWLEMDCENMSSSFIFQLRRKHVEGVTIKKMPKWLNTSMVWVAFIETDEKIEFWNVSIEQKWEEKRLRLEAVEGRVLR